MSEIIERPVRGEREPVAEFSTRIDRYVEAVRARQRKLPKRHTREIVYREKVVYRDHPAASMLDELEAAKAKIDERPPAHDEPPAEIADLFQGDRPFAEQAEALWKKYNELTQKVMMGLATDPERVKHTKLQGELDWIKRHAFEGV